MSNSFKIILNVINISFEFTSSLRIKKAKENTINPKCKKYIKHNLWNFLLDNNILFSVLLNSNNFLYLMEFLKIIIIF